MRIDYECGCRNSVCVDYIGELGVADFFAKKAVDKVGYATSLVINYSIALGPIFVSSILFFKQLTPTPDLVLMALTTGFLGFLGYFFFYKGLKKGNLSIVSPIASSWFVITIMVAVFVFGEKLMILNIIGVVAVFSGLFLTSTDLTQFKHEIRKVKSNGVLEALISMIAWGFAFAITKYVVALTGPFVALLLVRVIAFLSMFLWINISNTKIVLPSKLTFIFLIAVALLDAFGYVLYNIGVEAELISVISPIAAAYPAVTVVLASFFLKEKLTRTKKVGITIILTGLVLISLL